MMPPENASRTCLGIALKQALAGWNEAVHVEPVSDGFLRCFAHESSLGLPATEATDAPALPNVLALRVTAPNLMERHYLLATIRTRRMGEGDFPEVMACAARLRSHLPTPAQLELSVLLVGPVGHDEDPTWTQARRLLEGNEAFARVLVWLPPQQESKWHASAVEFVGRLFLGDLPTVGLEGANLSPTEEILRGSTLSDAIRERWRSHLLDPALKPKDRASLLLEIVDFEEGGQNADG